MSNLSLFALLISIGFFVHFLAKNKANSLQVNTKLHSLPRYYGYMVAMRTVTAPLAILGLWIIFESKVIALITLANFPELANYSESQIGLIINQVLNSIQSNSIINDNSMRSNIAIIYQQNLSYSNIIKAVTIISTMIVSFMLSYRLVQVNTRARNKVEKYFIYILISCASIAILVTIGIIFSVLFEAIEFFKRVPVLDFLFGLHWSPQIAIREGQTVSSGAFGAVPVFWGTIFVSLIALIIAVPIGLLSAVYLSEYASNKMRSYVKPFLEILAGIPTVVYGFFAALTVGPLIKDFGVWLKSVGVNLDIELLANISVSTESVLAVGIVMGMMIVPFVLSLSDDVISSVPNDLRDGSIAMGATKFETVSKVVIPAALPGVMASILLAASRAIGETMIVLMAAGVAANLTVNPLATITTVTVQIVTLLTGDQEFDNTKTLSAFALGLGLFITTLILNIISLNIVKKYREQYE